MTMFPENQECVCDIPRFKVFCDTMTGVAMLFLPFYALRCSCSLSIKLI